MKNELKEIKKNLKATLTGFKDAEKDYGYDLANETYYVKQALKQVNLLLLHNVSNCGGAIPYDSLSDSFKKSIDSIEDSLNK